MGDSSRLLINFVLVIGHSEYNQKKKWSEREIHLTILFCSPFIRFTNDLRQSVNRQCFFLFTFIDIFAFHEFVFQFFIEKDKFQFEYLLGSKT